MLVDNNVAVAASDDVLHTHTQAKGQHGATHSRGRLQTVFGILPHPPKKQSVKVYDWVPSPVGGCASSITSQYCTTDFCFMIRA